VAVSDARGRGDSSLERYVRQLLREADRARRTTQLKPRDGAVQGDRPVLEPLLHPPHDALADSPPPSAG